MPEDSVYSCHQPFLPESAYGFLVPACFYAMGLGSIEALVLLAFFAFRFRACPQLAVSIEMLRLVISAKSETTVRTVLKLLETRGLIIISRSKGKGFVNTYSPGPSLLEYLSSPSKFGELKFDASQKALECPLALQNLEGQNLKDSKSEGPEIRGLKIDASQNAVECCLAHQKLKGQNLRGQNLSPTNNKKEKIFFFRNPQNQELWGKLIDLPSWERHTPDMLEENYLLLRENEPIADEMMRYCIRNGNSSILPPNNKLLEVLEKRQNATPQKRPSSLRRVISDDFFSTDSIDDPTPSAYRIEMRRLWYAFAKSIDSNALGASTAYFERRDSQTTIKVHATCGYAASEFPDKEVIGNYFISNNIQVIDIIYE